MHQRGRTRGVDVGNELLRWVRLVVAALTITDLTYFLTSRVLTHGEPGPVRTAQNLVGYAAIFLSLARPRLGAWLGLVVSATCLWDGPSGTVYPLAFVGISMLWSSAPKKQLLVPTLGYALVFLGVFFSPAVTMAAALLMASAILVGLLVGYGTRLMLRRLRSGERRLSQLRHQQRTQELAEHQLVMSHVQGEIQEILENEWRRAEASSRMPDEHELFLAIDRAESASRYALGQLRSLVGSLRSNRSSDERFVVESIRECAEDAEDELISHGYDARLDTTGDFEGIDLGICTAVCRSLHWGVNDLLQHAVPGANIRLRLERSRTALRIVISEQRPGAGSWSSVEAAPIPEMLVNHLAPVRGTVTYTSSRRWHLDITIPFTEEHPAGTAFGNGIQWQRITKRIGVATAALGLIASVLLMVLTRDPGFSPETLASATACLAMLLSLLNLSWATAIGISSALVSLLSRSPWLTDLLMVGAWAAATIIRGYRSIALAVSLLASGYVAIRLVTYSTYLALFTGALLFSTLLAIDVFARRANQTAAAAESIENEIEALRQKVRQELAGELHDVVALQLSRIVLTAEAVRTQKEPSPQEALVAMADALRTTKMELELMATILANPGPHEVNHPETVALAAKSLVNTLKSHRHQPVITVDPNLDKINSNSQHLIVRILRECATNILRYAPEASECHFRVANEPQGVTIEVRSLLSKEEARPRITSISSGFGIVGLGERVRAMGGNFKAGPVGEEWVVRAHLTPGDPVTVTQP